MKTILLFEVTHDQPLPAESVELIGNRIYTLLTSRGIEVDVKEHALPVVEMADER
jgi:hypothetical protein